MIENLIFILTLALGFGSVFAIAFWDDITWKIHLWKLRRKVRVEP